MGDHYIPRLLLRRFAASHTRSGQALVFQFQQGHPPPRMPYSVDRIASERGFYDHPQGVSLDDGGMHDHEKRAGVVLKAVESAAPTEQFRADLAMVFSVMMARTRAMRDEWTRMVATLLDEGHRALAAPAWNQVVWDHVNKNFGEVLRDCLPHCKPEVQAQIAALLRLPGGAQLLQRQFAAFDFAAGADRLLTGLRSILDPASVMKKAHVDALLRVFEKRALTWHDDCRFEVLTMPEPIVLGDVCVLAIGEDGSFGTPMKFGRSCRARFLPISPHRVLAAVAADGPSPQVPAAALNRATAIHSREFFFSATSADLEAHLLPLLGSAPSAVPCDEIREITQQTLSKFPAPRDGGSSPLTSDHTP